MRTEEKPMIARDESLRAAAASLRAAADALLSALAVPPAAPAPSPTSYVPRVGDVVALTTDEITDGALPYRDSLGAHLYRVESAEPNTNGHFTCARVDGRDTTTPCFITARGMRPATASERAAAGLPVDEAKPSVVSTCCLCGRSLVDQRCKNRDCTFYEPTRLPVDEATTPLRTASPNVVDRTPPAATPAYPVDDKGRPLWVRFVADHSNDKATPRRVLEWDGDVATVEGISPHRKPNGCKPSAKAGEWEPCAAPAETPAAAQDAGLTEAEREELADKIREDRWQMSWDDIGAAARAYWLDRADAAAAWFAKRGGAK